MDRTATRVNRCTPAATRALAVVVTSLHIVAAALSTSHSMTCSPLARAPHSLRERESPQRSSTNGDIDAFDAIKHRKLNLRSNTNCWPNSPAFTMVNWTWTRVNWSASETSVLRCDEAVAFLGFLFSIYSNGKYGGILLLWFVDCVQRDHIRATRVKPGARPTCTTSAQAVVRMQTWKSRSLHTCNAVN
jgi:hypothetical protein